MSLCLHNKLHYESLKIGVQTHFANDLAILICFFNRSLYIFLSICLRKNRNTSIRLRNKTHIENLKIEVKFILRTICRCL